MVSLLDRRCGGVELPGVAPQGIGTSVETIRHPIHFAACAAFSKCLTLSSLFSLQASFHEASWKTNTLGS
ncbi:MAG: hypothetical protein ACLSCO_17205, partial [Gallintestinimicrobium sp.]